MLLCLHVFLLLKYSLNVKPQVSQTVMIICTVLHRCTKQQAPPDCLVIILVSGQQVAENALKTSHISTPTCLVTMLALRSPVFEVLKMVTCYDNV